MNIPRLILIGILLLVVGLGLGYYLAPDKVRVETKIVEKVKVVKEQDTKTTDKFDPNTGKVIEHTVEVGIKDTTINTDSKDKITEKTKTQKNYAIKVGVSKVLTSTDSPTPRVGAEVRLPFFNSWLGAEGDLKLSKPEAGAYLRIEF